MTIELTANGSVSTENTNEANLKSKFLTSSWGGNRKLPYVFTEQGVYMLMTVYHDRYIVVDYGRKTEKIYHCGASSKDAG